MNRIGRLATAMVVVLGVVAWAPRVARGDEYTCNGLVATIVGTEDGDLIVGTGDADVIVGLGGDDTILGLGGNDTICGNDGVDTVEGGAGDDYIDAEGASFLDAPGPVSVDLGLGQATGADGSDELVGVHQVDGSAFDDTLLGSSGVDTLRGGAGDDAIDGMGQLDEMSGGDGVDTLTFGWILAGDPDPATEGIRIDLVTGEVRRYLGLWTATDFENLVATPYDDEIAGTDAPNSLVAGDGDDIVHPRGGDDVVDGGDGSDTLSYAGLSGPVTIDLRTDVITGEGTDSHSGFEVFEGSNGDDLMIGNSDGNTLFGMKGDDTLKGLKGGDYLDGGGGDDLILGGSGSDQMFGGNGSDLMKGGGGRDYIRGGDGADFIMGGKGSDNMYADAGPSGFLGDLDAVSFEKSPNPVVVKMAKNLATGEGKDKIHGFRIVIGSRHGDTMYAPDDNVSVNLLVGWKGDDLLVAKGQRDQLLPGAGDDVLRGAGNRTYIDYQDARRKVTVNLKTGVATGMGTDTFTDIWGFIGSPYNDEATALGMTVDVEMYGLGGNDKLTGGSGADEIFGMEGNDYGNGSYGTDICVDVETRVSCEQVYTTNSDLLDVRVLGVHPRVFRWIDFVITGPAE